MIRIVIVEDDESCVNQLIEYLNRYNQESGEDIEIASFSDGLELLENYKSDFDIILLDVQMPFVDGITTAEEIRKIDFAGALQGIYKATIYDFFINAMGGTGETLAHFITMVINAAISFWVFFPIFRVIFKDRT